MPIGRGLWTVTVNNASSGPITDLEVDVYGLDRSGDRLDGACRPAKETISFEQIVRDGMTQALGGTFDAIGSHAQSMYGQEAMGMMPNFGAYGGQVSSYLASAPGLSTLMQGAQRQMVDRYPQVISRDGSAEVMYSAPEASEVRADLQFADEAGDVWRRRHGQQPEPVMEGE
ncbi:hypothetical protein A2U19_01390 [Dietzia maris]|nr:hypothetical protein A2U19_01390 [Dietzia maris]